MRCFGKVKDGFRNAKISALRDRLYTLLELGAFDSNTTKLYIDDFINNLEDNKDNK